MDSCPLSNYQLPICYIHNLPITEICMTTQLENQWVCRECKQKIDPQFQNKCFSLAELLSPSFSEYMNEIIDLKNEELSNLRKSHFHKDETLAKLSKFFENMKDQISQIIDTAHVELNQQITKSFEELNISFHSNYFSNLKLTLKELEPEFDTLDLARKPKELTDYFNLFNTHCEVFDTRKNAILCNVDVLTDQTDILDSFKEMISQLVGKQNLEESKKVVKSSKLNGSDKASANIQALTKKNHPISCFAAQTITTIEYCPDLDVFITGSIYGLVNVWDMQSYRSKYYMQAADDAINSLLYVAKFNALLIGSLDNIRIVGLDCDGAFMGYTRVKTQKPITSMVHLEKYDVIATISEEGQKIRFWEISLPKLKKIDQTISIPQTDKKSVIFFENSNSTLGIVYDNYIRIFNYENGNLEKEIKTNLSIFSAHYISSVQIIYIAYHGKKGLESKFWKGGKEISNINDHHDSIQLGSELALIGFGDKALKIYKGGAILEKIDVTERTGNISIDVRCYATVKGEKNLRPIGFYSERESKLVLVEGDKEIRIVPISLRSQTY